MARKTTPRHVDREEFNMWLDGYVLKRVGTRVVVTHDELCELAEAALLDGRCIVLTQNGQPWSTLKMSKSGKYVEKRI